MSIKKKRSHPPKAKAEGSDVALPHPSPSPITESPTLPNRKAVTEMNAQPRSPDDLWDTIDISGTFDSDAGEEEIESTPPPTKTDEMLQIVQNYIPGGRWLFYTLLKPIYTHHNLVAEDLMATLNKLLPGAPSISDAATQTSTFLKSFHWPTLRHPKASDESASPPHTTLEGKPTDNPKPKSR